MPPPPTALTFLEYFTLMWQQTVHKYGFRHHAKHIVIVIDKPEFLPPPRSIVHKSRASKSATGSCSEPTVTDDSPIPHNLSYSSLLAKSKTFKTKLIEHMTSKFLTQAQATTHIMTCR